MSLTLPPVKARWGRDGGLGGKGATKRRPAGPCPLGRCQRWFLKAAEQGDAEGQYCLATAYYRGEGVPKEKEQGEKWLRKAAEQGHLEAQVALSLYGVDVLYEQEEETRDTNSGPDDSDPPSPAPTPGV